MALFEFKCKKCNHNFEDLVRKEKMVKCPRCNSEELSKKVSQFAASIDGKNIKGNISKFCENCNSGDCSSCKS